MSVARDLIELAELHGVQTSYVGMNGTNETASVEALTGVLEALGVAARNTSQIRRAIREKRLNPFKRGIEPVHVAWDGRADVIPFHVPQRFAGKTTPIRLHFENGDSQTIEPSYDTTKVTTVEGERFVTKEISVPRVPTGYHTLEIQTRGAIFRSLVVSAPRKSYAGSGKGKVWGAFLPMYAAHSKQSWGAGNISDFAQLADFVGSCGATFAGTLPLLAAFLDSPTCEPSPYSPASRLFWNEFFIDIQSVPEFAHCAEARKLVGSAKFQNALTAFRCSAEIDYAAQWALRRKVLQSLADFFFAIDSPRRAEFDSYRRERPEVEDYAAFRAVCDRQKISWHNWPERLRDGCIRSGDYDEATKSFYFYSQWVTHQQMRDLAGNCRSRDVRLYLDLPLGVNPDGYDVWRERDSFALGANAGAPPDMFYSKGQDWGFSPLHPERLRDSGYAHVRKLLRFQMQYAGLLRIDHVMGLHRLYWIPRGHPATHGVYVRYPAEELYAIFNVESHRHQTMLAGENLGIVPPEVNRSMKRHGFRSMFVVQYQWRPEKTALDAPERLSVASLNTHDMSPFASIWRGKDLVDRVGLGLIPHGNLPGERQNRKRLKAAVIRFLADQKLLKRGTSEAKDVMPALLSWLSASEAEIVLVNLEDLWLETQPQNTPGTTTERPNWRHKARRSLERIQRDGDLRQLLSRIAGLRQDAK